MDHTWLVLGGWALPPEILSPVFGPDAVFLDVNSLVPPVVASGNLDVDWRASIAESVLARVPPFARIAGWSTGAIIAAGICELIRVRQIALLSVTPSFCQRQEYGVGWPPRVLRRLQERLVADPRHALANFYGQCGIPASQGLLRDYDSVSLQAGLLFLREVSLFPLSPLSMPCTVMHGLSDRVVPAESGQRFAEAAGGRFVACEGGHAFFLSNPAAVQREIAADG
jgi:pimeloyl-ACP methyl ester carboxylesterase